MTTARVLDPTDEQLEALRLPLTAGWALDQPHEPPPTAAQWRGALRSPWSGDPARLLVAGDGPCGLALVELPAHDNPHLATAQVLVAPGSRRRGVATALWEGVADLARAEGRRTVLAEARVGSPAEALYAAVGARPELEEVQREQRLRELDPALVARLRRAASAAARGYRLDSWTGPTPAGLQRAVAALQHTLNDAPMGGLDHDGEAWDAGRLASRDAAVVAAGLRMHCVVALSAHGEPAGFTDVAVSEDGAYAWQWGTGVVPEHRGHRLGLLLKATMVERLWALEPALEVVTTWNADSNAHMVAVNDALGYRPVDRLRECQADVSRAPARGRSAGR